VSTATTTERPRLKVRFDTEIRARLKEELGLRNVMEVPRLEKIVVNMGVGRATQQQSLLEGAVRDMTIITGQRPVSLAIPRIRDFRGLPLKAFDGHGNYTFGVTEQLIFPEVDYDKIDAPRGMDITLVTTATTDAAGRALLDAFGFPFRREGQ
jgi:large subunit ribosomal protein L5